MNEELSAWLLKIMSDFILFARKCVCIEGKEMGQVFWGQACSGRPTNAPWWELNQTQLYLLHRRQQMLDEFGWVRLIIIKGRQQGVSTLIEMIFLWLALFTAYVKICIISHEQDSAVELFRKATFAYEHLPPELKGKLGASNRKEMILPNGAKYLVLTAGSEESGRSQTAHHQHQSERGFFKNAEAIDAGAGQIVALVPKSEVYKESTGNGLNHLYHEVLDALAGRGVYQVAFCPWFWEDGYRSKPKPGFTRTPEEIELIELYGQYGLRDDAQLQWRRDKIDEFKGGERGLRKFRQEYPCCLLEAFQASGNAFHDAMDVARAMQCSVKATFGARVLGVDAAWRGGDRTVIVCRKGSEVEWIEKYPDMDEMRLAGILAKRIGSGGVDKCFVDLGGGHGTVDRLVERGYGGVVEGISFGYGADDATLYLNKRAEMAHTFDAWVKEPGVNLPNDDDMAADIASMPEPIPTSNGRLKFPPKEDIKKTYGRSPDIYDALLLTFAYPVRSPEISPNTMRSAQTVVKSELTTQQRRQALIDGNTGPGNVNGVNGYGSIGNGPSRPSNRWN